jgi:hypothetical protein
MWPVQKIKRYRLFQPPLLEKGRPAPMKVPSFVEHGYTLERDNKPHLKFHMKKGVFFIYRMIPSVLDFVG